MKPANCPQEANILKAVRAGAWEETLSTHLRECSVCREIARASQWMQALAQSPQNARALPDAGRVWWRAQFSEKQAKAERAQEIFEWAEILSASVICAGLAGWIVWNWYAIQLLFASLMAGTLPNSWIAGSSMFGTAALMFSSVAVILSLAAIVLAYPLLARD